MWGMYQTPYAPRTYKYSLLRRLWLAWLLVGGVAWSLRRATDTSDSLEQSVGNNPIAPVSQQSLSLNSWMSTNDSISHILDYLRNQDPFSTMLDVWVISKNITNHTNIWDAITEQISNSQAKMKAESIFWQEVLKISEIVKKSIKHLPPSLQSHPNWKKRFLVFTNHLWERVWWLTTARYTERIQIDWWVSNLITTHEPNRAIIIDCNSTIEHETTIAHETWHAFFFDVPVALTKKWLNIKSSFTITEYGKVAWEERFAEMFAVLFSPYMLAWWPTKEKLFKEAISDTKLRQELSLILWVELIIKNWILTAWDILPLSFAKSWWCTDGEMIDYFSIPTT